MEQINQDELAVIARRVQKLLNLASNNSNEAEASSALAKAQEILIAYNLDMASVGQSDKKRSDTKFKGGLYKWQRKIWEEVARLNFCMYWSNTGTKRGQKFEHRVLGSHVNVISTQIMADYLQEAIERITRDWAGDSINIFAREAIAYREGMADRISERLQSRRREQEREARKQAEEQKARQNHPAYVDTKNALTIIDIKSAEDDLNYDHVMGWEPGTTAANRAQRTAEHEAYMVEFKRQQEEKRKWELANPEEAARVKAETEAAEKKRHEEWLKKEARNSKRRTGTGGYYRERGPRSETYYSGYDKGKDVSLDRQVDKSDTRRLT